MTWEYTKTAYSALPEDYGKDLIIRLPNQDRGFRCDCGCNVFRKVFKQNRRKYKCNSCGSLWIGEK